MLQYLCAFGTLEGDQAILLQMVDFDLIAFLFDDLVEVIQDYVFVGPVDDNTNRAISLVVASDGVIDNASSLIEEHC